LQNHHARAQARKKPLSLLTALTALSLGLLLSACGGGGGGSGGDGGGSTPTPPPNPTPAEPPALSGQCQAGSVARLALESAPRAGRNTELGLLACGSHELSGLRWTQSDGPTPAQAPLSARSQAISLEAAEAGSYRFDLAYRDETGRSFNAPVALTVEAAGDSAGQRLLLRGEPTVFSGGSFSLRAWAPGFSSEELAQASLSWSQLDGPALDLSKASGWRLLATAPQLSSDALIRLRVNASLPDGRSASGQFNLLVQALQKRPSQPLFDAANPPSRVYPYLAQGPHAAALDECIYSPRLSSSNPNNLCSLGRLPLLGSSTGGAMPTVEQVMQRVLVSNDWMGEVFERFLREQDPHGDYRRMLASVTAVVIGGRVRPAFYWNATGAIYLDAAYLWLTPAQRDSLSETPDPRSDNGRALNYATPWRYVKDNRHAITSHPLEQRATRDIAALAHDLGRLMYHELSHAADFLPPRVHATLSPASLVYQAGPALTASQDLAQRYPFYSQEMRGLARVLSFGEAATAQQIAYSPADISRFFSQDRVNDDYSYSIPSGASFSREDAAMLVEEAMMQLRYGVLRDFGISNPLLPGASSADLRLDWGQRGRIGEAAIRPRLKLVLADLLPWLPADFADGLAPPLALRAGQPWGANLDQAALLAGRVRPLSAQQRFNELEQTTRELRRR